MAYLRFLSGIKNISRSHFISLDYFQERLQDIYEIDVVHRANDFLISDGVLADSLLGQPKSFPSKEKLLISEHAEGIDLSLYISADVISHINNAHPVELITKGKYSEFCLILEGVSHFLYLVWNAGHNRQVTLFEMELQAEIDKFILLSSFCDDESDMVLASRISGWLFEKHTYNDMLTDDELGRYEQASYYAGKYCMGLQQQYRLSYSNKNLLNELRRFYRFSRIDKLRFINRLN